LDKGYNATYFSFSLGTGNIKKVPHELACKHKGIWAQIKDRVSKTSIRDSMAGYYKYLAHGLKITKVIWSEPYEDAFGLGKVITGSLPVYEENVWGPVLVGVVGVDVQIASL